MEETNEMVLHLLDAIAQLPPEMEHHQVGGSLWKEVTFFVPGEPQGKGRPRFVKQTGRTYTPPETKNYERLIRIYYEQTGAGLLFPKGEPARLEVLAYFAIPASFSKRKRKAIESGELAEYVVKKPDWDNIGKVVSDALNGVAYHDDAQIQGNVGKIYGTSPGLLIRLSEMAAPPAAWMDQRGGEAE